MPSTTHPSAILNWRRRFTATVREAFRPKPRFSATEWAEKNRKLSVLNSSEPGRYRMRRTPYFREVLDAVSDPTVQRVVVMKSARVGYTQGVLENAIGYHIDQDPCSVLMVQPTLEDAEKWSKENLAPLIDETPAVRAKIGETKWKDPDQTILSKRYPGGILRIVGATSPRGFRRFDCREVYFDEVDGYPLSAENEGDPITLGEKRARNHWNKKFFYGSTPKEKATSRILKLWNLSDQRRWYVRCPHCGHEQVLRFGGREQPFGLKWETDDFDGVKRVVPGSVIYLCAGGACVIDERYKVSMVEGGRWIAEKPGRSGVRGYHISALYSLVDPGGWEGIAQEWLDAQGDWEALKGFINTVLGECWEQPGTSITAEGLEARAERWLTPSGGRIEVPHGVGLLTAGVDVQPDRIELLVKGWGAREESWNILHDRIYGDPTQPAVWEALEAFRMRIWRHASGAPLRVALMCVDSGYLKNEVYRYVASRQDGPVPVRATKGGKTEQAEPYKMSKGKNEQGVQLVLVGTVPMKDTLFQRLRTEPRGDQAAAGFFPDGYIHFRAADPEWHNGADSEYFAQFGRERRVWREGRFMYVNESRRPNEAIDLEVGNLVALHLRLPKATRRTQLAQFAEALSRWTPPGAAAALAGGGTHRPRGGVRVIAPGKRL
ncbi:MAG TPA: terminase gpA endonuclease subunit [Longimicrobium sp.]|jgi:phage terminase large subunit GpA-like protein